MRARRAARVTAIARSTPPRYHARGVQKLIALLGILTPAGRLYEVDARTATRRPRVCWCRPCRASPTTRRDAPGPGNSRHWCARVSSQATKWSARRSSGSGVKLMQRRAREQSHSTFPPSPPHARRTGSIAPALFDLKQGEGGWSTWSSCCRPASDAGARTRALITTTRSPLLIRHSAMPLAAARRRAGDRRCTRRAARARACCTLDARPRLVAHDPASSGTRRDPRCLPAPVGDDASLRIGRARAGGALHGRAEPARRAANHGASCAADSAVTKRNARIP